MECWVQWLLRSWVLWGLWVLQGKCWGHLHCCWSDWVAKATWVMSCK